MPVQEPLNNENHKAMLTTAYAQFLTPDAAAIIAGIVIDGDKTRPEWQALTTRVIEYGRLVSEMRQRFGDAAADYLGAHMSEQIEKYLGDGDTPKPHATAAEFLKANLWKRVAACIREVKPHAQSALRDQFLDLGEETVEQLLDRVQQYQFHWENKHPLPPAGTVSGQKYTEKRLEEKTPVREA